MVDAAAQNDQHKSDTSGWIAAEPVAYLQCNAGILSGASLSASVVRPRCSPERYILPLKATRSFLGGKYSPICSEYLQFVPSQLAGRGISITEWQLWLGPRLLECGAFFGKTRAPRRAHDASELAWRSAAHQRSIQKWQEEFNEVVLAPLGMICKTQSVYRILYNGSQRTTWKGRVCCSWLSFSLTEADRILLQREPHVFCEECETNPLHRCHGVTQPVV